MEDRKMKPRPRKGRRKVCQFCVDKVEHIDYKDAAKLRKFITERGKIMPRRMSGVCAEHQRAVDSVLLSAAFLLRKNGPFRSCFQQYKTSRKMRMPVYLLMQRINGHLNAE